MLTKIWRGVKVCLGVSQFVIALAIVVLLEAALVFGFLKWNPYVCIFPLENTGKPDSQLSGGPFPSAICPSLHSFVGVPLRCSSNHSNQERGPHADKVQEDLYHLPIHLHLGPLSHLHVCA